MAGLRDIPVKFLKGVGPQRSRLLAEELGIESYHDLLHHFRRATSTGRVFIISES